MKRAARSAASFVNEPRRVIIVKELSGTFHLCVRIVSFSVPLLHANILLEGAARAPRVSSYTLK